MGAVTGSKGVSATPATDFFGAGTGTGTVDTALLAASWEKVKSLTIADTGFTAASQVWTPPPETIGTVATDPGASVTQYGTLTAALAAITTGTNGSGALNSAVTSMIVNESGTPPATPFYMRNVSANGEIMRVTNRVLIAGSQYTYTFSRAAMGSAAQNIGVGAGFWMFDGEFRVDETTTPPAVPFYIFVEDEPMLVTARVVVAGSQYTYTVWRQAVNAVSTEVPATGIQPAMRKDGSTVIQPFGVTGIAFARTGFGGGDSTGTTVGAGHAINTPCVAPASFTVDESTTEPPALVPFDLKIGSEWLRVGYRAPTTTAGRYTYIAQRGHRGSTVASHTAGTAVKHPRFFVNFELDDANGRIRVRPTEDFDWATHWVRAPAWPLSSQSSSAATSDQHQAGTLLKQQGSPPALVSDWNGYTYLFTVDGLQCSTAGAGFTYVLEVRPEMFILGTRSGGLNYYVITGHATPLWTIARQQDFFAATHPANNPLLSPESTSTWGFARFSREPLNVGNSSTAGLFCYVLGPIYPPDTGGTANPRVGTMGTVINGGTVSKYQTLAQVCVPVFHGALGAVNALTIRQGFTHRAYLPDFILTNYSTEPAIGDTITVGGVVYYILGATTGTGGARAGFFCLAVKS